MKILITGSAGHLGEALMRSLRASQRHQAVGVDVRPSPYTDIVGSIADPQIAKRSMDGVEAVVHTATLHKPHVATHTRQDFVDTNITGTLNLLEEAASNGVHAFVFTSTTSTFGAAMTPPPGAPAVWVNEDVVPVPKNIYGVTKVAAENLCELFHRKLSLPCIVLRTSRFFAEPDDQGASRRAYNDANIKANEFLYRRADIEDIVSAHLLAIDKAPSIGFGRYIVSATTPFKREDLLALRARAPEVVKRYVPAYEAEYAKRNWSMFPGIERVYDNQRARDELGWVPHYDFARVVELLRAGEDPRSPMARAIGIKGYHGDQYVDGLYPVD